MLSFVYQPSFSGSPHPRPSLSLSTAASVYERQGWLLPTLATRGAGNALKATLTDTKHTRSDTITTNTEHARNVILTASGVLTTSNKGEGTIEAREEKKQQGGEARKEYTPSEALRQSSPTTVCSPVNFGQLAGCVTRDVSTLQSGTHNPRANLNRRHRRSHPCKPSSSTPIQSIQHPHGIGPTKPVITFPVTMSFKRSFVHTTTTN